MESITTESIVLAGAILALVGLVITLVSATAEDILEDTSHKFF